MGLVLTFYGFKMIEYAVKALLFVTYSAAIFMFFIMLVFGATLTSQKVVISAIVSFVVGAGGAHYTAKHAAKYGIALLAGWGALSLAFVIMPLTGLNDKEDNIYKLIIYIIFTLLGFFSAAYFSKSIEVFITAFIGSYSFVRGISLYAGGFINEFRIN